MKYLNKLASAFFVAALGLMTLTGCEGGELYNVGAPSWLDEKSGAQETEEEGNDEEEVLENMQEDVYDIGNLNFNAPFFTLGKTYVVPAGKKWNAQFNLTVNPDNKYFKNFYVVLNAVKDDGTVGGEYGVIRYDNDPSKNSEWNTISEVNPNGTEIDRSLVSGNFNNSSPTEGENADIDASVQKMNGKITLTVDRTEGGLYIKMTNGSLTKMYKQTKAFPSTGSDVDIACRIGVEGSYVGFLSTNVEPIGGCTSAGDKQPASLTITGVPETVTVGTPLEEAMKDVKGTVTFEETPNPKEVTAEDLVFQAVPNYEVPGEKTLIVLYNKTFKGENADKPVMATATFKVVNVIQSIAVTKAPATYFFYTSDATKNMADRTLAVTGSSMEVTATYIDGTTGVVAPSALTFSRTTVPAKAGSYDLTVSTENGKTATTVITVEESSAVSVVPTPAVLGPEDNSAGWWSFFTDDVKIAEGKTAVVNFTNYAGGSNWNNWLIILRKADMTEYGVFRADNYAWRYGINPVPGAIYSGDRGDGWATWLAAMNGAQCTAYITNCNNGTADIQVIMKGTDSNTYYQYYLGTDSVDPADLNFAFTVDGCHLTF